MTQTFVLAPPAAWHPFQRRTSSMSLLPPPQDGLPIPTLIAAGGTYPPPSYTPSHRLSNLPTQPSFHRYRRRNLRKHAPSRVQAPSQGKHSNLSNTKSSFTLKLTNADRPLRRRPLRPLHGLRHRALRGVQLDGNRPDRKHVAPQDMPGVHRPEARAVPPVRRDGQVRPEKAQHGGALVPLQQRGLENRHVWHCHGPVLLHVPHRLHQLHLLHPH